MMFLATIHRQIVKPRNGSGVLPQTLWHYTYYTYDARQHPLAVYERSYDARSNSSYKEHFSRTQQHILFPDTSKFEQRIGTEEITNNSITFNSFVAPDAMGNIPNDPQGSLIQDSGDKNPRRGDKSYLLKGEQQNVNVVITDRRSSGASAEVLTATDYFPFGMNHTDRQYNQSDDHAAFMSKEKTTALPTYNFGARLYNPALARWWSPDAHAASYPAWSPYHAFGNSPLMLADPDGNDIVYAEHLIERSYADYGVVKYLVDENEVFQNLTQKYRGKPNLLVIKLGDDTDWEGEQDTDGPYKFTINIIHSIRRSPKGYQSLTARYSEIGRVVRLLAGAATAHWFASGRQDNQRSTNAVRLEIERGLKEYVKEGKHAYTDQEIEVLSWGYFEKLPEFQNYLQRTADQNKITKEQAFINYTHKLSDLLYDVETVTHLDGRKETTISPYFRGH